MSQVFQNKDLVFDIGAHKGEDTYFYLKKGFRVIAVEANPRLVNELKNNFSGDIKNEQLIIVPFAISNQNGKTKFVVNLKESEWSSIYPEFGAREDTPHEEVEVETCMFSDLIEKFGVPYYVKIDIEGADRWVIKDITALKTLPRFVSVEAHSLDYLAQLKIAGYNRFKLVNQARYGGYRLTSTQHQYEGKTIDHQFSMGDSGVFGEDLAPLAGWKDFETISELYLTTKRCWETEPIAHCGWYDFHATA